MADVDIVIEICGSAGDGTISSGEILSRFMSSQGFEIMSFDSYPSEIRGFGKCVAHSRISNKKVLSPGKYTDILIALNNAHAISQLHTLRETGIVIFDNKPPNYLEEDQSIAGWIEPGMISYGIPLLNLSQKASGSARGRNMVALGALAAIFGIDGEQMKSAIHARYAKKNKVVIDSNINSFAEGFTWAQQHVTKVDSYTFGHSKPKPSKEKKAIINGNQAVAQAAIDSGLHLYAGYPITPATKIMEIVSRELPKKGGVMVQTEDEISAIGHVIGAGYAGKRAMTATSGPGFCLMSELANLAVMAEVPAVLVNSQRGGPSTGLPTRNEQSDLNIALFGGSGDSPRIVLAPTSVNECYTCTTLAFYLAEKYQTLVIILLDFFLSNSIRNITTPVPPKANQLNSNVAPTKTALKDYKRYKLTKNGISPRAIPGTPGGMCISTGLEHSEHGHPRYDRNTHPAMTEKRFNKIQGALSEAPKPRWVGPKKNVDIGVIAWGSTAGSAHEAVLNARKEGINVAFMSTVILSPFPVKEIKKFSEACSRILVPELNYTGQFANVLSPHLSRSIERLNMVTGLPISAEDILEKIRDMAR
ncbi:MAG: 2-oxoacid:acceptor oxidoreductase subunit alpha [Desulfobacterales bacterium]|nr:2-oxoacid:acceptor oxidoreductase subunit alpha [Desulfobacterales bacterium]